MRPVVVRRLAESDIFDAIDYYVEHAPKVVKRFITAIDGAMEDIGRSPGIGSPSFAEVLDIPKLRFRALKSFPFAVFYQEIDTEVVVLRVLHHGRDVMNLIAGNG